MDLGARQHVNNARYLSYLEEARIGYRKHLGLPLDFGVIIADTHITYHLPIFLEDEVKIGVRVVRIGNKSIIYQHEIVDAAGERVFATAEVVMVAYDYQREVTVPVSVEMRKMIAEFEGLTDADQD